MGDASIFKKGPQLFSLLIPYIRHGVIACTLQEVFTVRHCLTMAD